MSSILDWLEDAVSWILVQFHAFFESLFLDPTSGWAWALSIVGLVVVIRIALIPLFVKQIKSQRNLQIDPAADEGDPDRSTPATGKPERRR